ncbi:hypothetical protein QQP08_021339 [Theobroma cacao]|nr:hypothetical protein QQP08_021339 [Theobroma cacao]
MLLSFLLALFIPLGLLHTVCSGINSSSSSFISGWGGNGRNGGASCAKLGALGSGIKELHLGAEDTDIHLAVGQIEALPVFFGSSRSCSAASGLFSFSAASMCWMQPSVKERGKGLKLFSISGRVRFTCSFINAPFETSFKFLLAPKSRVASAATPVLSPGEMKPVRTIMSSKREFGITNQLQTCSSTSKKILNNFKITDQWDLLLCSLALVEPTALALLPVCRTSQTSFMLFTCASTSPGT